MEDSEDVDDSDDNEDSNDDEDDDIVSDGHDGEDEKRAAKPPLQSDPHIYTVLSDFKAEQEGDLSVQVKYFLFQRQCTHFTDILHANNMLRAIKVVKMSSQRSARVVA